MSSGELLSPRQPLLSETVPARAIAQQLASRVRRAVWRGRHWLLDQQQANGEWALPLGYEIADLAQSVLGRLYAGRLFEERDADNANHPATCAKQLLWGADPSGGWPCRLGGPRQLDATILVYWALKVLGTPLSHPAMRAARSFVLEQGGLQAASENSRRWLVLLGQQPREQVAMRSLPPAGRDSDWALHVLAADPLACLPLAASRGVRELNTPTAPAAPPHDCPSDASLASSETDETRRFATEHLAQLLQFCTEGRIRATAAALRALTASGLAGNSPWMEQGRCWLRDAVLNANHVQDQSMPAERIASVSQTLIVLTNACPNAGADIVGLPPSLSLVEGLFDVEAQPYDDDDPRDASGDVASGPTSNGQARAAVSSLERSLRDALTLAGSDELSLFDCALAAEAISAMQVHLHDSRDEFSALVSNLARRLLNGQCADGAWREGDHSPVATTCAVVETLARLSATFEPGESGESTAAVLATAAAGGANWLWALQAASGAWCDASDRESAASCAAALTAMVAAGEATNPRASDAAAWLISEQKPDGSWAFPASEDDTASLEGSVHPTAAATRALALFSVTLAETLAREESPALRLVTADGVC